MSEPKALILRAAGTNCDLELTDAFERAGARADRLHLNRVIASPGLMAGYDLLGLPGGFSYGDDVAAGRIFAHRLRHRLWPAVASFITEGRPVIGICNGFQQLVKAGLLPGFQPPGRAAPQQTVTLTDNAVPRFVDRWVGLSVEEATGCIWTRGIDRLELPVAHGEGRFVASERVLDDLEHRGQVVLRYEENPNGSMRNIAGICDPAGLVFGLMPHPERFTHATHHPDWTRRWLHSPAGLEMFVNAVEHVREREPAGVS